MHFGGFTKAWHVREAATIGVGGKRRSACVYICKGCFSEVDKHIKLQADVESVAGSIRSKLRAQGLSIADSGPSIGGQVAIEGSSVSSTNSCMILGTWFNKHPCIC